MLQQSIDFLKKNWKEFLFGGGILVFILKIIYNKWANKPKLLLKVARCDYEAARNEVILTLNLEISNQGKQTNSVKNFSWYRIRPRTLIIEEAKVQVWSDGLVTTEHRITPVANNPSKVLNTAMPFMLNPGETVIKWLYLKSPNLVPNQLFKMKLIIEDTFGEKYKTSFFGTCRYAE